MAIGVDELVSLAGAALEAEDRYILGCSTISNKKGGLLRFPNERYYQFVVCRGWLSRWDTTPERHLHDAVISVDDGDVATIEMKCWRSDNGEPEISGIRRDIEKLKKTGWSAFMMIFSANEASQTEGNFAFLYERLPELRACAHKVYSFPTVSPFVADRQVDFWVAGWQLK